MQRLALSRSQRVLLIEHTLLEAGISIYATIAQKWPVSAVSIYRLPIDFCEHDFFAIA